MQSENYGRATLEPVSVLSNRVSANKIWISKNTDRRLASKKAACGKIEVDSGYRDLPIPAKLRELRRFFCGAQTGHRDGGGWLGRLDSNQGMAESKSAALPLGYAPIYRGIAAGGWPARGAEHSGENATDQCALVQPSIGQGSIGKGYEGYGRNQPFRAP
jgi:hypothetical protein